MKPLLLLALLCGPLAAQDPVHDWIVKSAVRLDTPEARHGFADMAGIKKIVGNARVVSLGEATHGTREFFQLKHRMLEYLATEMGFTIFSIEANMPEAYQLNDYVLKGEGDPAQLLKGMYFWTWNTEEVLDMIKWMREFNQSGKGRVEFTGFDMQTPTVAAEIAAKFLKARDEAYAGSEEYKKACGDGGTTIGERIRRRDGDLPGRGRSREGGEIQRVDQDGKCDARVCRVVVASGRSAGRERTPGDAGVR
jgi:erythromycin esterase-like protein